MGLVPRLFRVALVASVLAGGSGAALADDTGNGSAALSTPLPSAAQDSLLPTDHGSSFGPESQKFDSESDRLDFFSVRPEIRSGDFTSLLGNGTGGGGLKFHLNW
jgi:hypothetical protein